MIATNSSSSFFAKHVALLLQLHKLIARGQGDDRPADDIRDEMDFTWRGLSADDRNVVEGLSADLYTLTDPPITAIPLDTTVAQPIQSAIQEENWPKALDLIRTNEKRIPTFAAAYWRGLCWGESGHFSVAAEFFERAARLAPPVELFWECLVVSLLLDRREKEAQRIVNERSQEFVSPRWCFIAADVVLLNAESLPDDDEKKSYLKAIELIQTGIRASRQPDDDPELRHSLAAAYLRLAISYDFLGDIANARNAVSEARRIERNNLDAMLVSGFLQHQEEQEPSQLSEARNHVLRAIAVRRIPRASLHPSNLALSTSA
jgi:tetratricopeptide (TPR) repeat protein